MTLYETFIDYLDSVYMEPERKGVERGKEIGVYRSTHNAIMYSLYNCEEKEKARRAGISYLFLRKLRCTERFKELVELHRLNFVEECVFTYFSKGYFFKYNTYYRNPKAELRIDLDPKTAFADASLYDYETKKMIADWLIKSFSCFEHEDEVGRWNRIFNLLIQWNEPGLNKEIYRALACVFSEEICKLLCGNDVTDEKRECAIQYAKLILKFSSIL